MQLLMMTYVYIITAGNIPNMPEALMCACTFAIALVREINMFILQIASSLVDGTFEACMQVQFSQMGMYNAPPFTFSAYRQKLEFGLQSPLQQQPSSSMRQLVQSSSPGPSNAPFGHPTIPQSPLGSTATSPHPAPDHHMFHASHSQVTKEITDIVLM